MKMKTKTIILAIEALVIGLLVGLLVASCVQTDEEQPKDVDTEVGFVNVSNEPIKVRVAPVDEGTYVISTDKLAVHSQEDPEKLYYTFVTRFAYKGIHFIQFGTGQGKSIMLDPFVYGTPSESSTSQINRQIDSYNNDYKSLFGD